jgi:pyruvate-ferredoxin/flavodoxin oxidoreductase
MPDGAISLRIHSVGGWGAITMGKNVVLTAFELARPARQGQPEVRLGEEGAADHVLRDAVAEPIRLNGELRTWTSCCRRTPTCSATRTRCSGSRRAAPS